MNTLQKLQQWYLSNCNGDWEHSYGVEIGTLDNPGWRIKINLSDTSLETKAFTEIKHQIENERGWYRCWREENEWHGAGGPEQLTAMLDVFLNWAMPQGAV